MAFVDRVASPTPKYLPGPKCKVFVFLESLSSDEREAFEKMLADSRWTYSGLSDAIGEDKDYDVYIAADSLSRHIRGRCADNFGNPLRKENS